jgi:UDP-2,3-diacylglucosamine pyrophosphatase LpxH
MLRRSRHGEKVIFIPGSHDEVMREYAGTMFGNMVNRDYIHTAADSRRYLLLHGDEFDQATRQHRWIALLGDKAYDLLVSLNVYLSWLRRTRRIPGFWPLAGHAKRKVEIKEADGMHYLTATTGWIAARPSSSTWMATWSSSRGSAHPKQMLNNP